MNTLNFYSEVMDKITDNIPINHTQKHTTKEAIGTTRSKAFCGHFKNLARTSSEIEERYNNILANGYFGGIIC